jgi:hypothetical protein
MTTGAQRNICFGATSATSGYALVMQGQGGASASAGGNVSIIGGTSGNALAGSIAGGIVTITGGLGCNTSSGQIGVGGSTVICGGCGCGVTATGCGGAVCIVGGYGSTTCGNVFILNGATIALCALTAGAVGINYNNSLKLCTLTNGACITGCGFATDFVASSDRRLKTGIIPISNALSMVMELQGVCYCMCDDCENEIRVGLIAQDVEKVLPEVVSHSVPSEVDIEQGITDDKLGLKYNKLTAVLIEAIKEQQHQIDILTAEINNIKSKTL